MTAKMMRVATAKLDELNVEDSRIVSFNDIGSEGAIMVIRPPKEFVSNYLEYTIASQKYGIARDGSIQQWR